MSDLFINHIVGFLTRRLKYISFLFQAVHSVTQRVEIVDDDVIVLHKTAQIHKLSISGCTFSDPEG